MKLTNFSILMMVMTVLAFSTTSCKKDEVVEPSSRFESQKKGSDEMEILIDTETNLVWVNDARGCFAAIISPGNECAELVFAGISDWRTPSPDELSALITEIAAQEMKLNYINASCALMSSNEATWVFTENSNNPGGKTVMMPGNAGLRCVANQ